ncbi:MAG: UbiX family flavin prenyltransferase [Planctomycetaceae bacterium]|nr:UbiX family flavin prenyltransferase [Planctomycetaceae bacterium]
MSSAGKKIVLAMTGASGAGYAVRLLDVLLAAGCDVAVNISPAGAAVLKQELDLDLDLKSVALDDLLPPTVDDFETSPRWETLRSVLGDGPLDRHRAGDAVVDRFTYHHHQNLFAPIASGSSLTAGMVVCPCSGGTLSGIAHGTSANLIQRAADVHLKERRKLILVPRETPLSMIQLDNMRRCAEAGAVVLPAMPGWYHGARTLRDLVDFVVARICDQLGVANALMKRWGEAE